MAIRIAHCGVSHLCKSCQLARKSNMPSLEHGQAILINSIFQLFRSAFGACLHIPTMGHNTPVVNYLHVVNTAKYDGVRVATCGGGWVVFLS